MSIEVSFIHLSSLPSLVHKYAKMTIWGFPGSGALWRLKLRFDKYTGWGQRKTTIAASQPEEAVYDEATKEPEEREKHGIQWTVASLTDDH